MPYLQQTHLQQARESRSRSQQSEALDGRQPSQQPSHQDARMQCQHNIVKHQVIMFMALSKPV